MNKLRQLSLFCHKMDNALRAGFDIEKALLILQDEEKGSLKAAITRCHIAVQRGKPLSSAMRDDIQTFTPELVNLVYVCEQTGHWELAFSRMAQRFEAQESTRRKIHQAATYPVIVLIVFIIALLAVASVWHFLPQAITVVALIFLAIAAFLFLRYSGSELGRHNIIAGNILIHTPVMGRMILLSELADFAENLAIFYGSGVLPHQALRYCARSVRYGVLRDKVLKTADLVEKGNQLSVSLQLQEVFPADLINSISSGEASGNVDGMLLKIAEYYRSELKHRIDILSAIFRQ